MQIFNNTLVLIFSGFQKDVTGITLYPFIFSKVKMINNDRHKNHELIHLAQQKECFILFFYIIYVVEYLSLRLIKKLDNDKAYHSIRFEAEAYLNQNNLHYLKTRKRFAWKDIISE